MPSKAAIAAIRNMRDAFDKLDEGEWSKDDKKFFARKIQGFVVGAGFSSLPVAAPATATAPPAKQRSKGTVSYCNVTNSIIADMLSSKKKKQRTYKYDDKFRKAEIAAGRISDGAGNNAKSCKHWWPKIKPFTPEGDKFGKKPTWRKGTTEHVLLKRVLDSQPKRKETFEGSCCVFVFVCFPRASQKRLSHPRMRFSQPGQDGGGQGLWSLRKS